MAAWGGGGSLVDSGGRGATVYTPPGDRPGTAYGPGIEPMTPWRNLLHRWPLPRGVRTAVDFLRFLWRRFNEDDCPRSAAALTLLSLFAIVPLMTVAFSGPCGPDVGVGLGTGWSLKSGAVSGLCS